MLAEKKNLNEVSTNSLVKMDDLNSIEGILAFGETLVKSKMVPHNSAADVMGCILMGRELGFGAMASVNHIYSVNGRANPDIHIISAKLLQGGVIYKILKNYEPIVNYLGIGKTFDEEEIKEYPHLFQRITAKTPVTEYDKTKEQYIKSNATFKVGTSTFNDLQTVIYFERKVKQLDGTYKDMCHTQTFKWSDAVAQEWTDKSNWVKMPSVMMLSRCLAMGGRFIADDLLLGVLEFSEASDVNNSPYRINLDGNAEPLNKNVVLDDTTKVSSDKQNGSSETTANVITIVETVEEAVIAKNDVTAKIN